MARHPFPSHSLRDFHLPSERDFPVIGRFRRFINSLPPSDKFIAALLGFITLIACVVALIALMRSFQVVVPAHGGALTEGVVGSPRFVNPILAITDSDRDLVALTYAGLLGHDAKGGLIPVLAQSYTVSDDGTSYTFILREDATFSDGSPVSADDVVYTISKAQDPGLKSPVYASWANIRAEAVDAKTVRFTLPNAYAPFLEDATLGILPQHVWKNVSDEEFPFSPYTTSPIGAGPFKVSSVSRDDSGVITGYSLSSFKHYALGEPYLARIKFSFFDDQLALGKAFQNGQVMSAYGISSKEARAVPYARVFGVFFNADQNASFADLGVRKALSLAIDRTKLTKETLGGYAKPLAGPIPAGSDVPEIPLPTDATRIDEAKQALTDAGYEFNTESSTWIKDGVTLTATLTTSSAPELKTVATQVQTDWQALGVPTELELHDPSELTQTVIRPRAYGALLFGEVVGLESDLYAFWAGSERTGQGLNIANYSNEDVDALLERARTSSDAAIKRDALTRAQQLIAADYPAAFLYTPDFLYNVPSTIRGVSLSRVSAPSDRFWDVSHWYRYSEHVWPIFAKNR